jgi:type II secretory pathway component PulJ
MHMRARQRGITLLGLIFGSFLLVLVALLAMRLLPSYIEYFTIKKNLVSLGKEAAGREATVNDIRRSFESRTAIDDITSIKSTDLVITKEGNGYLIAASYRREVALFANIGVYIDFEASSR